MSHRFPFEATARVYKSVIAITSKAIEKDFEKEGIGDVVITELRTMWLENIRSLNTIPMPDAFFAKTEQTAAPDKKRKREEGEEGEKNVPADANAETEEKDPGGTDGEPVNTASGVEKESHEDSDESDLGSELSSDIDSEDDPTKDQCKDQVQTLFEFIRHRKSKYKCSFINGIVEVDGKELVLHKGSADFTWGD